ncbi:hypothetical protein QTP70_025196, partial [Hemibagrus guttatus]
MICVCREILLYPTTVPESQSRRRRGGGDGDGEKAKPQVPVSSVGEERALLLGFVMMGFSILMYFAVGIVVIKPCIHSDWGDPSNCSLIQAAFLNDSDERAGGYPCLHVLVNATAISPEKALHLRYDEAAVNLSPECFYTPKNHQNKSDVVEEAYRIKDVLFKLRGEDVRCYLSTRYREDAILTKRHNLQVALQCLVWPSLLLFGGALLISSRAVMFWGCRWATQIFNSLQRFSMGLRSGDWLGHSRTLKCFLRSHSFVARAVCLGSLSCWKTQPRFIFNALADGR